MLVNLLSAADTSSSGGNGSSTPWMSWIMMGLLLVVIVVMMVFNSRKQKKAQEEQQNLLDAIQPGNKVKTIGGVCGVVVEVCPEDNTFVLETGTEKSGKSYMKFDKQAVYQTDAVVTKKEEVKAPATEEKPVAEEAPAVEEAPAAEETKAE